jgi:hypothetical protein
MARSVKMFNTLFFILFDVELLIVELFNCLAFSSQLSAISKLADS